MAVLNNKIDFAVVFTVRNANSNGDPLDGNRPRTTYDGHGEVTDVCLKRKIRNRLLDENISIFVQQDDRRADEYRSLKDRADGCEELKACYDAITKKEKGKKGAAPKVSRDDYALIACKTWYDVRAFGQVFSFKKGTDADAVSIGVRGPVTIQSAYSIDPINVISTQITKSVNLETGDDPDKKGADTMGMKHRVEFGVYQTFGSINVQTAQKTGFSEEDADLLKEALRTLFRNDATSARPDGSMEVIKVVWWKHNCPTGQYSSAKVHRSLRVICDGTNVPEVSVDCTQISNLEFEVIDGE